jgi:hypothetical protein
MKTLCKHELFHVSGGNALDTVTGSFVSSAGGSFGSSSSLGGSVDESNGETYMESWAVAPTQSSGSGGSLGAAMAEGALYGGTVGLVVGGSAGMVLGAADGAAAAMRITAVNSVRQMMAAP